MRLTIAGCYVLFALSAFAQTDRGTITGTVSDPAGAVVPNASVEAKNQGTSVVFKAATTNTGNYTLSSVPAGTYEISVSAGGFKKYLRPGVTVNTAETVRVDAALEVGAATETITVNEEAPLLKTESGELSHQIDYTEADALPIFSLNGAGGSTGLGNIRDPLSVVNLLPGASQSSDLLLRINGMPSSSQTIMVEGQDATNGTWREVNQATQQGVDAIQEVSIQTSNFAAEYGQAGGGYFNYTMKSGTNQYHGSAYDYFQNEFLNAGLPFTDNGNGGHIKNELRRNDYGFTLGGPVRIPHVYNGKDKTFFFFNFEQFRQSTLTSNGLATMPVPNYLTGNFSQALLPGFQVCPGNGSGCYASNTIFQPGAGGGTTGAPFPNNTVPKSMIDPVAAYMQTLFPAPTNPALLVNNYAIPPYTNFRHTTIPSIKIDQALTSSMKLSGYFSDTITNSPASNGWPQDLAPVAPTRDYTYTTRINFDDTITPTLLLHIGVGLFYYNHPIFTPTSTFDASAAAASNGQFQPFPANTYMPSFAGLNNGFSGGLALGAGFGAPAPGPSGFDEAELKDIKPTGNASLTWVRGNHTYKTGMTLTLEGFPQQSSIRAYGEYTFSNLETENPAEAGYGGPFFTGFNYASFLMGRVDSVESSAVNDTRLGNHAIGLFLQDNWKVTHKLTLDYGLRWDYATLLKEQYGRMSDANFQGIDTQLTNPQYPGGIPGNTIYGDTCHCNLNNTYPFSIGPRLGVAYQVSPKTVIRVGGGISYSSSPDNAFLSYSVANFYTIGAPGFGIPANTLANGNSYGNILTFPNYPFGGQFPYPNGAVTCGGVGAQPGNACIPPTEPFITIEKGTGRLPRIFQWSIGVQREVLPNLLVEAAYVGNRGAWWTAPLMDTQAYDMLNPATLATSTPYGATSGLNVAAVGNNPSGPANCPLGGGLLSLPINSPCVTYRYPGLANPNNVYSGFPGTEPLLDALRPYPQWTGVPPFLGPPMGDTWYDSLQVKVTKRYSRGLTAQMAYTWSKALTNAANSNTSYFTPGAVIIGNPLNTATIKQISGLDIPQALVISFSYTTPKNKFGGESAPAKAMQWLSRDWSIAGVLRYQSGALIASPPSANNLGNELGFGGNPLNGVAVFGGGNTLENPVAGQSCLAVNPNSKFDPTKTLALNPGAFSDVGVGTFGVAAPYYENCRWQRQPAENLSLGRIFRVKEKYQLQIRMELNNPFNRVFYSAPSVVNNATAATFSNPFPNGAAGALSGGYGFVNTLTGAGTNPRNGQLVARFTF